MVSINKLKLIIVTLLFSKTLIPQQMTTLAVLDFEGLGVTEVEAKALTNRLRAILVKTGTYQVVERGKMDAILDEQGFQLSGCTSEECVVEVGQLLGVQKMLAGSISLVGKTYSVEMRIIDVELGRIDNTSTYDIKGEIDQLLTDGMESALSKLLSIESVIIPEPAFQIENQYASDQSNKDTTILIQTALEKVRKRMGSIEDENDDSPIDKFEIPEELPKSIDDIKETLILIKGGTYKINRFGYGEDENVSPSHEISVNDFYISNVEVTQELYKTVIGSNPSYYSNKNDHPVEQVNWYDAIQFCNKLSQTKGFQLCYKIEGSEIVCDFGAAGYRLPTEAEWVIAAGSGDPINQVWSGTSTQDSLIHYSWFYRNSQGKTHPVSNKKPNNLGIYDMSGNVWEWCWDEYDQPVIISQNNPTRSLGDKARVIHSGSWVNYSNYCQIGFRDYFRPTYNSSNIGFRVVRTVTK
ncbi:SUMF1/EgtB/PvdO family nonheme iron enzyme [bacterium]|nr:SUMF1/EgtB/PvdO family nonheme iron enzyme [bacterium]MBU1065896.1 SUMF1/EgtB/PvdO family nonheme iron enzyme [bacterium]MBU1873381.1 SUMF1/EgtB/PvdO family nonheme iron enzyme [bacterium]